MSQGLSESGIARAVADAAARRITRRVIAALQRMNHTLSGEDSGLRSTWDEICVQVQYGHSFFWDAYDKTIRSLVAGFVAELPDHEKAALWLRTDAGFDWRYTPKDQREGDPVLDADVVDYVTSEHVYSAAGFWSNKHIRDYNDRSGAEG